MGVKIEHVHRYVKIIISRMIRPSVEWLIHQWSLEKSVLLSKSLPGGNQVDGLPPAARLRVGTIHLYCRQRVFMMTGLFFEFLRSFLPIDFVLTNFTATFRYCYSGSYLWFACLCVTGRGKSKELVAKRALKLDICIGTWRSSSVEWFLHQYSDLSISRA